MKAAAASSWQRARVPAADGQSVVVTHLVLWERRIRELHGVQAKLEFLTGAHSECKLMAPAWDLAEAYTRELALRLQAGDWLQWFWLENRLGEACMGARAGGVVLREVRTIRHLARIIVAHRESPSDPRATALLEPASPSAP